MRLDGANACCSTFIRLWPWISPPMTTFCSRWSRRGSRPCGTLVQRCGLCLYVGSLVVINRQIDHAVRLMQAVERHQGFQPLRAVWDAAHEWIFVQALERTWQSMERECHDGLLTEDKLRNIVLQLVSLIHFLHAHGLSLVGEVSYRNLMVRLIILAGGCMLGLKREDCINGCRCTEINSSCSCIQVLCLTDAHS